MHTELLATARLNEHPRIRLFESKCSSKSRALWSQVFQRIKSFVLLRLSP